MPSEEDIIIANGLKSVREGILKADWSLVCLGYNSISGEDLSVKPVKTRLETIREKLLDNIKEEDKNKEVYRTNEHDEPIINVVQETKQKGGERFGQGNIIIISSEENLSEKKQNKDIHQPRNVQKRNTELKTINGKGVRLNTSNERRDSGKVEALPEEDE